MRKDDGLFDGAGGTGREIDRRTIAKGVAWTVPVVIVATAAPAAAASYSEGLVASKQGSTWTFSLTLTNKSTSSSVIAVITQIDRLRDTASTTLNPMPVITPSNSSTILARGSETFTFTQTQTGKTPEATDGDVFTVHYTMDGTADDVSLQLPKK
jgi:hypothetical protein